MLEFRLSNLNDIPQMMKIVDEAKTLLKSQNIDQWQTGYPNRPLLEADVAAGIGYVLADADEIIGICAVTQGNEASYLTIKDGSWQTTGENYLVVHRLAIASEKQGQNYPDMMLAKISLMAKTRGLASLRADTHPHNQAMQKTLARNGFFYCGLIHLAGGEEDGQPRLAYEKKL